MHQTYLLRLTKVFGEYSLTSESGQAVANRGFRFPHLSEQPILFVGHNPSFREGDQAGGEPLFQPNKKDNYYRHYFQLAEECGFAGQWNYLDILHYRETKQQWQPEGDEGWIAFLCAQLRVAQDAIEQLQPQLIVVCNSTARRYWGVDAKHGEGIWMGYHFDWKERLGAHVIEGVHSKLGREVELQQTSLLGVPVLFSSFNQYKSKGDQERLAWHIRRILRELEVRERHGLEA